MNDIHTYFAAFGRVEGRWIAWADWAENFSLGVRLPLTHYGTGRPDSDDLRARSYSSRGVARAIRNPSITSDSFYSCPEPFRQLAFDSQMYLERSAGSPTEPGSVGVECDMNRLSENAVAGLMAGLLAHIDASYGFGGSRHRLAGPLLYAFGVGTGLMNDPSREERIRWRQDLRHTRRFEHGYFRAAFPLNLLSDLHLAQRVGDGDLAAAIEAGHIPGSLRRINDTITLWQIPEDGLAEAQRILVENNLLV